MYAPGTPSRSVARRGFTLIELLVVIGIIALLVAITAATVTAVLRSQTTGFTETNIQKLASGFDQQWQAVLDQAADDYQSGKAPPTLNQVAGGNPDVAKRIYIWMRLKQEFPSSFAEAQNPTVYQNANGTVSLPPKRNYIQATSGLSGNAQYQAGVCLVMALNVNRRGMNFSVEDAVGASGVRDVNGGKVVIDGWGNPIGLRLRDRGNFIWEPEIYSAGPNKVAGDTDDLRSVNLRSAGARGDK